MEGLEPVAPPRLAPAPQPEHRTIERWLAFFFLMMVGAVVVSTLIADLIRD